MTPSRLQINGITIGLLGDFGSGNSIETIAADGKTGVTVAGDNNSNVLNFSGTILDGVVVDGGYGNTATITGNGVANTLRGGEGNDAIKGFGGNDALYGDAG